MRPNKLTIEGFTSFAERAEIDFSDLDLFAVIGPTGSGKTSLLDAMTWVLFGKTPRLNKASTDLISHGVNKMAVYLEFSVGKERYRVGRTARRSGSPVINLEQFDGGWRPLETGRAADTNTAVAKIIGLDFDAFTKSVILPQGKFDSFLRGEHRERREILKSLLGLEVYDRMREIAGQRRDRLKAEEDAHRGVIERDYGDATNDHLKVLKTERTHLRKRQKENSELTNVVAELWNVSSALADRQADLSNRKKTLALTRSEHDTACGVLSQKATDTERIQRNHEKAQAEFDGIVIDETKYAQLLKMNERAERLAKLQNEKATALTSLSTSREKLESEENALENAQTSKEEADSHQALALGDLEASRIRLEKAQARGSADLLTSLSNEAQDIPSKEKEIEALDGQKNGIRGETKALQGQIDQCRSESIALQSELDCEKENLDRLKKHDAHRELRAGLKKGELCPVCEQVVSVVPKLAAAGELKVTAQRVKKIETDLQGLHNAIATARAKIDAVPQRLRDLDERIGGGSAAIHALRQKVHAATGLVPDAECVEILRKMAAEIRVAAAEFTEYGKRHKQAETVARTAANTVGALEKKVVALTTQCDGSDREVQRLSSEIESILPEVNTAGGSSRIASDLAALNIARTTKDQLAKQLRGFARALQTAHDDKAKAGQNVAILNDRIRTLTTDIDGLSAVVESLSKSWSNQSSDIDLPDGINEKDRVSKKREQLRAERDGITREMGVIDATIADTQTKITRLTELRSRLDELRAQRELYDQLASALRANQLIDYLLETAYADLCAKGSDHLARLSEERYSFTAGKNEFYVKDAWNADAERSASTLSGGESFMASLALALALADSATSFSADGNHGTKLEALFLDEGVSTLDQDEALPAVIDALASLQTDDRMICVISHMENLAERLPNRIEIVKNHGRSTLRTVDAVHPAGMP